MGAEVTLDAVLSSGGWTNASVTGGTDRWTNPTDTTNYTWSGPVAQAGRYEVSVFVPAGVVNATNRQIPEVFYTVVAADGSHRVAVNQKANANKWVVLGTYDFRAGSTAQLHLSPNHFQAGVAAAWETASWGTDRIYVSDQAPKLVWRADSVLPKPLRWLLVSST